MAWRMKAWVQKKAIFYIEFLQFLVTPIAIIALDLIFCDSLLRGRAEVCMWQRELVIPEKRTHCVQSHVSKTEC